MRVFITGGAGFIGGTMAERLHRDGHDITIFDNFSAPSSDLASGERISVVRGDVLDQDALNRAMPGHDLVCHFASNPDIAKGARETDLDLRLSTIATHHILEAMRLSKVRQLIFPSGSGVYGDRGSEAIKEDFGPLLPVSLYGAGKLAAEALISAFAHMFDMRAMIFRPANVVGGRQTHGVAFDFIKKLKADPRKLEILGDGKQSKSYVHVDDLLDAMLLVLERSVEAVGIFNIATDELVSVDWIANAVIEGMHLQDVAISYSGGRLGWPGDVPLVRLSTGKIKSLGWTARHSSREALTRSIEEMLELTAHLQAD